MARRLLVLAYYFPPLGGSGVQRVARLVKYLPENGWTPVVVTPTPGAYFAYDDTLREEVEDSDAIIVRTRSLDPTRGHPGRGARPTGRRAGVLARLTAWVALPDNKLGWAPFAVRAAQRVHRQAPVDAVLASAPPYTSLLVGAWLARRWQVSLVLDLRDDWLGNPRHVYPTRMHRRFHAALERWAFRRADTILTISDAMRDAVARRHPDLAARVHVVPQGFDPADFPSPRTSGRPSDGPFRIVYAGMFYDVQRPDTFLAALARLRASRPDLPLQADFYGHVPPTMVELVERHGLGDVVRCHGYVPHREVTRRIAEASLLWLTIGHREGAEGISTGKLFEYVGTRRPILGLVPLDGTAAAALREYGCGWAVDSDDVAGAVRAMGEIVEAWQSGTLPTPSETFIGQHDRRRLAAVLAADFLPED